MGKLWDRLKRNRKGHTLIELTVSFALIGMLMGAAGTILLQGMGRHYQMMARLNMISVSRMILDKVAEELSGAKNNGHESTSVRIISKGSTGSAAVIFTSRKNRRTEITRTAKEGHPRLLLSCGQQWYFDEGIYQGCEIEGLEFDKLIKADGRPTNVIKVSLTLRNKKTGSLYAESRCVPLRQFITEEDIRRIVTE